MTMPYEVLYEMVCTYSQKIKTLEEERDALSAKLAEAEAALPKKDPRIGKLCWVWDGNGNPHRLVEIVREINVNEKWPILTTRGSGWKHAALITDDDIEKYIK